MQFIQSYEHIIQIIINAVDGQDKVVHMSAGLIIWLASAILLQSGLKAPWPLVPVFIAEAANETIDRISTGSWRWHDTIGDIAATIFWPLAICFAIRHFRGLRK